MNLIESIIRANHTNNNRFIFSIVSVSFSTQIESQKAGGNIRSTQTYNL
jgi:hypothetical protein